MSQPTVNFIGTLPPPFTGMNIATRAVLDALEGRCTVRRFNLSHPRFHSGIAWKLARGARSLLAVWRVLLWRPGPARRLYAVANSRAGLWYTIALAAAARLRNYHVYLHHHVFVYIDRRDWRMSLLVRVLGSDVTHIMLCPEMVDAFQRLYGRHGDHLVLSNAILMLDRPTAGDRRRSHTPFRLGHISNLTREKGLDVVIETLAAARGRGREVELVVAGPTATAEAARLLNEARDRFGDALDYRGPVYDDEKWGFYSEIDVLLFPTRYRLEAFPMVVVEALCCGVPVIVYGRACIPTLVGGDGGVVVDPSDDYLGRAIETLERWITEPEAYGRAAERAADRGRALREEARHDLDALLRRICSGADT